MGEGVVANNESTNEIETVFLKRHGFLQFMKNKVFIKFMKPLGSFFV